MLARTIWTLVRHSAWTAKQDPRFKHAVETQSVEPKHVAQIIRRGGFVFDDYSDASAREDIENYPPNVQGLIPRCPGSFFKLRDGTEVYVRGKA